MTSILDLERIPSVDASSEQLSRIRWGRVLLGGITPHLGWNVVLAVLVVLATEPSVAAWLPALSRPGLVGAFGAWGIPVFTIVVTGLVAAVVGRTVDREVAALHGLLVGSVAAMTGLAFGEFLVAFVLTGAAGWLGGVTGRHLR